MGLEVLSDHRAHVGLSGFVGPRRSTIAGVSAGGGMSFRDTEERRLDRAVFEQLRARRLRFQGIILAGAIIVALVVGAWFAITEGVFRSDILAARPAHEVTISFGFSRQPATRNFAVDITTAPVPNSQSSNEAVTVRLASDLRREDHAGEFPAEQVTVGINRLTPTRVNLTINANPWTPEKVPAGLYIGTLELRGTGVSDNIPLSIWLRSRENKWAALAFTLLFLGALIGLLVKWITERLTTQASFFRRLSSLKEAIGYREESSTLPISVRLRLQNLEDQIGREDYAAAQALFKNLEQHAERLALLASQFQILLDQLAGQTKLVDSATLPFRDQLLLEGVIDSEYRDVQDLLTLPWEEDGDYKELRQRAGNYRNIFGVVSNVISEFTANQSDPALRAALNDFQASQFDEGVSIYFHWQSKPKAAQADATPDEPELPMGFARPTYRPSPPPETQNRQRVRFLFRQARVLAAAASVIVVSLVGLKLQYLDDQQFDGALAAWLGLVLWGAIIELSGVSVLDVVGRLGSGGSGTTASTRG
jgi:hypothetical protein